LQLIQHVVGRHVTFGLPAEVAESQERNQHEDRADKEHLVVQPPVLVAPDLGRECRQSGHAPGADGRMFLAANSQYRHDICRRAQPPRKFGPVPDARQHPNKIENQAVAHSDTQQIGHEIEGHVQGLATTIKSQQGDATQPNRTEATTRAIKLAEEAYS